MGRSKNIHLSDNHIDERVFFKNVSDQLCSKYRLTAFDDSIDLLRSLYMPDGIIPDMIFADMNMPEPNGAECVKIIRELPELADVPVVVYSVTQKNICIEEIHTVDATIFINDAFEPEEFASLIRDIEDIGWQAGNYDRKEFLLSYNNMKPLQ